MRLSLVSIDKDGVVRVACQGNITCDDFRTEAKNPLETVLGATWSNNRVILDLDRTPYIDSSAIGWLIETSRKFKDAGGALAVHSVRPAVRQVLELLKVGRIVSLAQTEIAARQLIAGGN